MGTLRKVIIKLKVELYGTAVMLQNTKLKKKKKKKKNKKKIINKHRIFASRGSNRGRQRDTPTRDNHYTTPNDDSSKKMAFKEWKMANDSSIVLVQN